MFKAREIQIKAPGVRSLSWVGDELVDWVDGGARLTLDGQVTPRNVSYAYDFDAAVSSPSGDYAVIYTRLQTKGLILKHGKVLREINRSFYQAGVYEYPIAILRLKNGREVLAHCPEDYNRLELEDIETGECLTQSSARNPSDYFHSRLAASANGDYLLSAGWVWHPMHGVRVFDVQRALQDPQHLDGSGLLADTWADDGTAAFLPENRVVIALNGSLDSDPEDGQTSFGAYQLPGGTPMPLPVPNCFIGNCMALGNDHLLSLLEYPKVVDLRSGEIVREWPHIASGNQTSCIIMSDQVKIPPIAFDPVRQRFAVAAGDVVYVLLFG